MGGERGDPPAVRLEGAENIKAYEYAALVTNLDDEVISIVQH